MLRVRPGRWSSGVDRGATGTYIPEISVGTAVSVQPTPWRVMAKIALISLYEVNYLGTRLLTAWLRANGHEAHNVFFKDMRWQVRETPLEEHTGYQILHDSQIVGLEYDTRLWTEKEVMHLRTRLAELQPDIIGLSTRSPLEGFARILAPHFRAACPNALCIAGGYGPSLDPETFLGFGFDAVVRGDGEEALLELAHRTDAGTGWHDIPNICAMGPNGLSANPLAPQKKDITAYPHPTHGDAYCTYIDGDTLHRNCDPLGMAYVEQSVAGAYSTYISRGCAGRCTYCSGGSWNLLYEASGSRSYKCRKRALDDVLDELENIDRTRFNYINFVDECYPLTKEETLSFFGQYRERIHLPFSIYLNYEKTLKNPDLYHLILKSGFDSTAVGIQTGSEEFAKKYYHRSGNNSVYQKYIKILFDSFVTAKIQFIQGNCYETDADFRRTLDFIGTLPFDPLAPLRNAFNITRLKIFPGAPLTAIAPEVVKNPMPAREWWRRGLLMELRRFASPDVVEEAMANAVYAADPSLLKSFLDGQLRKARLRAIEEKASFLGNKDVIFYGAGKSLLDTMDAFLSRGVRPLGIAVDKEYIERSPAEINGYRVHSLEDILREAPGAHVLAFSKQATRMCRRLHLDAAVEISRLHPCTL